MSFGAGVVMIGVKNGATEGPRATGSRLRHPEPGGPRREQRVSVAPSGTRPSVVPAAFYALAPGGWRDYWTLLHPPYTLWHLAYALLGAALASMPDPGIVVGTLVPFFLAVAGASSAFDELQGRPLATRVPT